MHMSFVSSLKRNILQEYLEKDTLREVKTRPKFHCDFCNRTSTKDAMEKHEIICWKNPNRHCESCNDTGVYREDYGSGYLDEPCYFCKQMKPELILGENYFA